MKWEEFAKKNESKTLFLSEEELSSLSRDFATDMIVIKAERLILRNFLRTLIGKDRVINVENLIDFYEELGK
jgi:hypothetical protein